jgi:dihydrofolate synthase/folylpolyglutamate synthase
MLSDKQVEESVDALASIASRVYTLSPYDDRAIPSQEMANLVAKRHPELDVVALDAVDDAREYIDLSSDNEIYAFVGSLYMIGDARTMLVELLGGR